MLSMLSFKEFEKLKGRNETQQKRILNKKIQISKPTLSVKLTLTCYKQCRQNQKNALRNRKYDYFDLLELIF